MSFPRAAIAVLALGILSTTADAGHRGHGGGGWGHRSHSGGGWGHQARSQHFRAPIGQKRLIEHHQPIVVSKPAPVKRLVLPAAPVAGAATILGAATLANPTLASPTAPSASPLIDTMPPQVAPPVAPSAAVMEITSEVMPEGAATATVTDQAAPDATVSLPERLGQLSPTTGYAPPLPAPQLPRPLR